MSETEIRLPHRFKGRSYQRPLLDALTTGTKRAVLVAHRRSGKDTSLLNYSVWAAAGDPQHLHPQQRIGTYYHIFPTFNQGRKVLWDGRNYDGMRFLAHFPRALIKARNEQEMQIELVNGSIWQIVGSDKIDALVGTNPVGCVFSEYAIQRPQAWEFLRPILRENGGWAAFCFTPRGRNHGWELYQRALSDPTWFCQLLTVRDTRRDAPGEDGQPIITDADIERERREGMPEPLVQQEYFCSWEAAAALQFIAGELVSQALQRPRLPMIGSPIILGCDPARFGDDRSVILIRQGAQILEKLVFRELDTMQLSAQVCRVIDAYHAHATFIDGVGLGAGVVDRCRQLGYRVIDVNSGSKAMDDEHYGNLRAEMWAKMRQWVHDQAALDPDRDRILAAELQAPEYRYDVRNRLMIERKEDMKARGIPSPDEADALALTFAQPVSPEAMTQRWQGQQAHGVDWDPLRYDQPRQRAQQARGVDWDPLRL